MAVYGKVSAHGVFVSKTNVDLTNTGVRYNVGSVVTIPNLLSNEKYCFAVGAFNGNEELSNDSIGTTSQDIPTLIPLPINLIYGFLAKMAYQIGDFETANIAAEKNASFFIEKSNLQDRFLDYSENPLSYWRIQQKRIFDVSFIEIQSLVESLIVKI